MMNEALVYIAQVEIVISNFLYALIKQRKPLGWWTPTNINKYILSDF